MDAGSVTPVQMHKGAARGLGSRDRTGAQGHQVGSYSVSSVQHAGIVEELGNQLVDRGAGKLHNEHESISIQHRQGSQYSTARLQKRSGEAFSTSNYHTNDGSATTGEVPPGFHFRQ